MISREEISREEISREEISREEISREEISREEISREEISREEISREKINKEEMNKEKPPKKKIGIIGGGQLGKMLIEEAHKLGYSCTVLDPDPDACGGQIADKFIIGNYDDEEKLKEFAENSDIITYEFENVKIEAIEFLKKIGKDIPQGERPLYISQNRIREKEAVSNLGIKTAKYMKKNSESDLIENINKLGYPCILKSCSGGYDGKNQWILKNIDDLEKLNEVIDKSNLKNLDNKPADFFSQDFILEELIDLKKEVSCIVIRNLKDEIVTFPIGENIHVNGILDRTTVPSSLPRDTEKKIEELSKKIMKELDFIGILAIEYFIDKNNEIYFNEMAPRPHNSGHYTQDACDVSQFKLHLLSILNEDLVSPKLFYPCVMRNILGESKNLIKQYHGVERAQIHIYGKKEWKQGRKMGHINIIK